MSNALTQVVEYLTDKVHKVNVNNPKANTGGVLLKLYDEFDEQAEKLVDMVFRIIQMHFTKDTSSNPAGTAGLTMVSSAIGLQVHQYIKREPVPWNMQIRLGDLFIESFKETGFIDLYYPKARDTSYIVSATAKWIELAEIPALLERMGMHNTFDTAPSGAHVKQNHTIYEEDRTWVRSVNKLQAVGWRINRRVYDALIENKDLFVSSTPFEDNDAKEMKRRSKTVEWAFIMAKGKKVYESDAFYQSIEADYRGRLYYKESFLNYQGSDLARGVLKFARGKPMTESGLFWLAVHTANSFNMSYKIDEIPEWCTADYTKHLNDEQLESISVDKMTLEDRVIWTNTHMSLLVEAGRDGILSNDAEKKVSFLAACIEWFDYDEAQKDNRIHMTHLPIGIDGSNNGWQHLGAISKDRLTGKLVGLIPSEIQKDFYVSTAKELHTMTVDPDLLTLLDSMPMKHIRKGISKRGSMTRAYSAGAEKIGENMWFDCKAEDFHEKYGITEDDCKKLSKILIKAINIVCPGPLQTMSYLQNLAAFEIGKYQKFYPTGEPIDKEYRDTDKRQKELYIMKDKTEDELQELSELTAYLQKFVNVLTHGNGADRITWTTPSGFDVEYTCWNTQTRKCKGSIAGQRINHVARVPTKTPDVRGFMCGISPNYIHSMDASHMALVIDEWGGEFGAVHDSFSTHACDVEQLLALTKSKFIEMYDVDNYYDIARDNLITNQEQLDVEQPVLGDLNIEEIEDSDYFFA